MPSCCKQVREFVDFGKHLHGKLKELYDDLNEHAQLERVKMLLDFLSRHEQQGRWVIRDKQEPTGAERQTVVAFNKIILRISK